MATFTIKSSAGKTFTTKRMGYGAMNLTMRPEPVSDEQAFETIKAAMDAGSTFLDLGEFYGMKDRESNLEMFNRFFVKYPDYKDKAFVSVKGGLARDRSVDSSTEGLRESVMNSQKHLGDKKIDLFEPARIDRHRPIEEIMKDLKAMVEEGLFDYIGLSEVSGKTVRAAHRIHPISVVEVEYSPWDLSIEKNDVLDACIELGIPIAAFSPLGRGFLTGNLRSVKDIPEGDYRHRYERFHPEHFDKNLVLVDKLVDIAKRANVTPAQLSLAWILSNPTKAVIFPIPGSTRKAGVLESLKALDIKLPKEILDETRSVIDNAQVSGRRSHKAAEENMPVV